MDPTVQVDAAAVMMTDVMPSATIADERKVSVTVEQICSRGERIGGTRERLHCDHCRQQNTQKVWRDKKPRQRAGARPVDALLSKVVNTHIPLTSAPEPERAHAPSIAPVIIRSLPLGEVARE